MNIKVIEYEDLGRAHLVSIWFIVELWFLCVECKEEISWLAGVLPACRHSAAWVLQFALAS